MLIITIPKTMAFSNGMKLLDMMPSGYDSEYITSLFEALGEDGRHAYLYSQLPVDMIYPLLFGISYCLIYPIETTFPLFISMPSKSKEHIR